MRTTILFCGLATACSGKSDDTGNTDTNTTGGFSVTGTVRSIEDGTTLGDGLCIEAVNPSPILSGMSDEPEPIATGTVQADGSYTIPDVVTQSAFGILTLVTECDGGGGLLRSAAGIPKEAYIELDAGAVIADHTSWVVTSSFGATLDADFAGVGFSGGSIADLGLLVGIILDDSEALLAGAVADCGGCADIFYPDANLGDGRFETGGSLNAQTQDLGLFMSPQGPINNFTVTHPDHTYPAKLGGSLPGYSVFVTWWVE